MRQGSGGMLLVDPLYQRCLAAECRRRGVPVVFDEVFTGIWRLGALSAAAHLGVQPDIACYAKLLTGRGFSFVNDFLDSGSHHCRRVLH